MPSQKFIDVLGYISGAAIKRRLLINVDHIKVVSPNKSNGEDTLIYFGHNDCFVVCEPVDEVMKKINSLDREV